MTSTAEQLPATAQYQQGKRGLRCLDVDGWSFDRIHRELRCLKSQGWTLAEVDTVAGRMVLLLVREDSTDSKEVQA